MLKDNERPMGRLSGLRVKNRIFQVQTEYLPLPDNHVVTIVVLDGRVVKKEKRDVGDNNASRAAIEELIDQQHASVRDIIKQKMNELVPRRKPE